MTTLLMRISAPMQSWGTQSHFSHRDTGREPSKERHRRLALRRARDGHRHESIADLRTLKMGVRLDKPGTILRDFHTAGIDGYYKVSGSIERKNAILSERYYLSDAKFLVGLEGERTLLRNPTICAWSSRAGFSSSGARHSCRRTESGCRMG